MTKEQLGNLIITSENTMYHVAKTLLYSDADCADAIQEAIHLGKETVLDLSKREELPGDVSEKDIPQKEVDVISRCGMEGSPEYSACSEWKAFLDGYDTDGAILSEIGNGFAG